MKMVFFGGSSIFAVPALREMAEIFEVALVVTNPEKPVGRKQLPNKSMVEDRAEKLGLPVINAEAFTDEIINKIKGLAPDFFVIVDYGKIIPQKLLDIPPYGAINVHPSPLPKYRGASPLQTALLNGEKETAFSIMLIDDKVDHGPILAQKKVEIFSDDTYGELYKRLSDLYPKFLSETIKKYLSGEIKPISQDDSRATFTKLLSREDGNIDWNKQAEEIGRMIRAYHPWPGTFTKFKDKNLKILKASISENNYSDKNPGDLFKTPDKKLAAKCGKGILILEEVRPEGKKTMSGEEFARGYLK
ncbi:MAG: methionyl-tRNA formyltransferase [Patescibacteria group bacterium]